MNSRRPFSCFTISNFLFNVTKICVRRSNRQPIKERAVIEFRWYFAVWWLCSIKPHLLMCRYASTLGKPMWEPEKMQIFTDNRTIPNIMLCEPFYWEVWKFESGEVCNLSGKCVYFNLSAPFTVDAQFISVVNGSSCFSSDEAESVHPWKTEIHPDGQESSDSVTQQGEWVRQTGHTRINPANTMCIYYSFKP